MHEYEVCLSFAGQDRKIAQALARELVDMSVTVFFDEFDSHQLLGENLVEYLTSVYSIKARYCVIIASEGYASRKWTKNIELPAAQSRLLEQGSGYIIPLIVDDTNIPGILSSCGHIDLRKKSVEEAAYQIGKKVLAGRYTRNDLFELFQSTDSTLMRFGTTDSFLINLLCGLLLTSETVEVRFMSFTPLKLVSSPQFRVTVELLAERLQRENLDGTFRFYFLSDSKTNIQRFSARSREPANDLREKLGKSKHLIENLFLTEAQRRRLRLQTLEFSGFPAFHLWQIGDIYLYRSFDFGQKQDSYTIFMEKRSSVRADFCRCLDNMFIELESRSKITTMNWF